MRILAVRGANLASLVGEFEIDFSSPPLSEAGIFAITGRTGSGKSTLLDAICLALYDKIPRTNQLKRISQRETDKKQAQLLRANDVRTILRTSAVEGYAEVDFVGQDQQKYRARWMVRRARRKISGNLLPQELSLINLEDGTVLGGKKSESLSEIKKRVGLEFEQFSRTVLLSQGEFDAFLKADENERGILLEALTGTGLYSKISIAVHERARKERTTLARINTQLGENRPLSAEERQQLEQEIDLAKANGSTLKTSLIQLQKAWDWHQRRQALEQQCAAAQSDLQQRQAEVDKNQPHYARLAQARQAHGLRPEYNQWQQSRDRHRAFADELARIQTQCLDLARQNQEVIRLFGQASQQFEQARQVLKQAQTPLNRATELDSRIQTEQEREGQGVVLQQADQKRLTKIDQELENGATNRKKLEKADQENKNWLQTHQSYQDFVDRLTEMETDLVNYHQTAEKMDKLAADITATKQNQSRISARMTALQQEWEQRRQTVEADEKIARTLQQRLQQAADPSSLQKKLNKDRALLLNLRQLLHETDEAQIRQQQIQDHQEKIHRLTEESADEQILLEQINQQFQNNTLKLDEARRADQLAQATAGEAALALRALLIQQHPCPVCGGTEHPLKSSDQPLTKLAQAQANRVAELVRQEQALYKQKEQTIKKQQRIKTEQESHLQAVERLIQENEQGLERWQDQWNILHRHAEFSQRHTRTAKRPQAEDRPIFSALLTTWERGLQQDEEQLNHLLTNQTESHRINQALTENRSQLNQINSDLMANQALLAAENQKIQTANQSIGLYQDAQNERQKRLNQYPALPSHWPQAARRDPGSVLADCRTKQEQWLKRQAALTQAQEVITKLDDAQHILRSERLSAQQALRRSQQEVVEIRARLTKLKNERSELFNGEKTQTVRAALEGALSQAEERRQQAQRNQTSIQVEMARLSGLEKDLQERMKKADGEQIETEAILEDRCRTLQLSQQQLEQGLDWKEAELVTAQQEKEALQEKLNQSSYQLLLLQKQQAEQLQQDRPAEDFEQTTERLKQQQQAVEQAEEQLSVVRGRLHEDDRIKKRASSLLNQFEEQQNVCRLWNKMDDLIGSNEGDKFRKFAQSLTLDRLIELANHHLKALTPRYGLQRSHEGNLSLQVVDFEMGGEVRGIANLSGGERFLASLAMALGLASMSGNRGVQIESLFIDEGFGALDEGSLNMAVSALEALHATGRVVGVISHVPALTERIGVQVQVVTQGGGKSKIRLAVA
ncbi:MAG: AAA family ATPase [Magnetococcales bacterium]|nr:AAA family ATPase [Magnetococcales bacterium]